jgi:hypothetical protein
VHGACPLRRAVDTACSAVYGGASARLLCVAPCANDGRAALVFRQPFQTCGVPRAVTWLRVACSSSPRRVAAVRVAH